MKNLIWIIVILLTGCWYICQFILDFEGILVYSLLILAILLTLLNLSLKEGPKK
ncbi:hypothetical protein [Myroides sp. WP-1]|uniref:hypothetical protein n=1 Tax=Myroides sp. WP-1 TaxID=2759944 RepID=UPI001C71B9AA|nr:hypothetical protein [Myroides sp. WP-1]